MKALLFSLAAFALLVAPTFAAPAGVAELWGTPDNLAIVHGADSVDVCLLRYVAPAVRSDGSVDWSTERFEETAFQPVPAATVAALRDLLLDGKTYDWTASHGGHRPHFYLRLRFHRGTDIVAVDFCFMCHVLNITRNGIETGHANFGHNSDLFLEAFLKVFPHDGPLLRLAKEAGLP